MVQLSVLFPALAAGISLVGTVFAHPGEAHLAPDLQKRASFINHSRRSLEACAPKLKERGIEQRAIARRQAMAEELRAKKEISKRNYLKARDFTDVLAKNHTSNLTGISLESDPSLLFTGNVSCVLEPEVTEGPYYVDGELVRADMRETQEGVDLYADIQIIDVSTCEPVTDLYVDWWHCNSTGVYSGIVARGNGLGVNDSSNINTTFLRGIQKTDEEGVLQFTSLFPGHYTGRTPHVHVLTHNGTLLPNNTITKGTISHVGQIFFDQDLITEVELNEPYSANAQSLTLNSHDGIMGQEAESMDPVMEYVLLGDTVADGLMAWISIGIDPTASYNVSAAATWTSGGGVANPNAGRGPGGPGGPGGPPPGTGFPGGFPTGFPPGRF